MTGGTVTGGTVTGGTVTGGQGTTEANYSGDSTIYTAVTSNEVGGHLGQPHVHICTALGGGLGILSAVLTILLIGAVFGWVWSCQKTRGISDIHEK